jgi:hypothetical protein
MNDFLNDIKWGKKMKARPEIATGREGGPLPGASGGND